MIQIDNALLAELTDAEAGMLTINFYRSAHAERGSRAEHALYSRLFAGLYAEVTRRRIELLAVDDGEVGQQIL